MVFGTLYMTDTVQITPITLGTTYGKETAAAAFNTIARVENESRLIRNNSGDQVRSEVLIMLPAGTDIKFDYNVKVLTRYGVAVTQNETYKVKRVDERGNFFGSHIEAFA